MSDQSAELGARDVHAAAGGPGAPIVLEDLGEDRYSRFRLIPWWDQERLRRARVMVVGAGALGNEIIKNLALLGVGSITVVDMDRVENSNLSRSVLYRAADEGLPKAEAAARGASGINPDTTIRPLVGNVLHDVGLGLFRAMDVVIGGLDNREARLWVNQCCWRANRPWVDGAIEVLNGIVRVFVPPDGACYECTMNETDRRLLAQRKSCTLLQREQIMDGRSPTTPTTSAVIAGIQCQEALKLLHARQDLPVLSGKGFYFNGATHDSFVVTYPRRSDCLSHETWAGIREMPWTSAATTLEDVLDTARRELGPSATLDLGREVVTGLACAACGREEHPLLAVGRLTEKDVLCPCCGSPRAIESTHTVAGGEPFARLTPARIGLPTYDVIAARADGVERFYEFTGDRPAALGGDDR